MKVLITGACGYLGSRMAAHLAAALPGLKLYGMDNLSRRGSESNLPALKKLGMKVFHGDIRSQSDTDALPTADWVVDCAANPSVLAGSGSLSDTSSRQLLENNLGGTVNLLEYCKSSSAGFILISTSRVYSIEDLCALNLKAKGDRLVPAAPYGVKGFTARGVTEEFPTRAPISLYGATKAASETLALEYGSAFGFPVRINRCGVIGGPGQFGRIDQGIISFWVYSRLLSRPLKFIGHGGRQVRDCMDASDAAELVLRQIKAPAKKAPRVINAGGGLHCSVSLRELDAMCTDYFGRPGDVGLVKEERRYDVPYYVTDYSLAEKHWGWRPSLKAPEMVRRVCDWASANEALVRSWME